MISGGGVSLSARPRKDLISNLMQEATEETEHKGFCDTELTTNKQTRDQKTEAVAANKKIRNSYD